MPLGFHEAESQNVTPQVTPSVLRRVSYGASRFAPGARIGLIAFQHESNSFAPGSTLDDAFVVHEGDEIVRAFSDTGTEIAGAMAATGERGADVVPIFSAFALPSAPLDPVGADRLLDRLGRALVATDSRGALDALVVVLHGAATTITDDAFDQSILDRIGRELGRDVPVAATVDLHANVTADLLRRTDVAVGYATNPHTDQFEVGRRAVELLAAVLDGSLQPARAIATCPALFPDEALRVPGGVLDAVLEPVFATLPPSIVEVGLFPTQPWLDARGVGFSAVVTADHDRNAAAEVARSLAAAVWDRRDEFGLPELATPVDALRRAALVAARPAVVTEASDAPTAGAAGDGTAMLDALVSVGFRGRVLATIADPFAVRTSRDRRIGSTLTTTVGARIDPRWGSPVAVSGRIINRGRGEHRLRGECSNGRPVTMGEWIVLRVNIPGPGQLDLLVTEMPAWSGDPGPWLHADLDPGASDVLMVRSCSDYLANFPQCVGTSVVVDSPGPASPRLERYPYARAERRPYPAGAWAGIPTKDAIDVRML